MKFCQRVTVAAVIGRVGCMLAANLSGTAEVMAFVSFCWDGAVFYFDLN